MSAGLPTHQFSFRGGISDGRNSHEIKRRIFSLLSLAVVILAPGIAQAQNARLSVVPQAGQSIRIAWPATATGFTLEQSPAVGTGAVWTPVAAIQIIEGNEQVVRVAASASQQFFRLRQAQSALAGISETSPAHGEGGVAVTRETIIHFTGPLSAGAMIRPDQLQARFGERRLLTRAQLSDDRAKLTLFYLENLPASSRIRVLFDTAGLTDTAGRALDGDGDNQPGGVAVIDFDTVSITPVPRTAVLGSVYRSQLTAGALNSSNTVETPLPGVRIEVIGAEETIFTTTDAMGNFVLNHAPAGRFFVRIDGRTSPLSSWPNGDYYPVVEKAWEVVAGRDNNLAGGTGTIYLPLIMAGTLQPVSPTRDTMIEFPAGVVAQNPELTGVTVMVPANSLFANNGTRGGRVGIAPVSPSRLPEPLPLGLEHVLDISIQTDGAENFDRPLPVRFPNLPDPKTGQKLPPGAKTALWSYNHDLGRWEVQGSMTVTADGNFIESDPGEGVRQPGWHGVSSSTSASGPRRPPRDPCDTPTSVIIDNVVDLGIAAGKCAAGLTGIGPALQAIFDISIQVRELINNVKTAIDKAKAGENVAATAAVFKAVNNTKTTIVTAIDAFKAQNPIGKALAISKCVGDILSQLDNICGRTVSNTGNCHSVFVRFACVGIGVAKTTLNKANALIEKMDKGLKELGLVLVCGLIDNLATLLDVGTRGASLQGIETRLGALDPNGPVPPDVIAQLEDILELAEVLDGQFTALKELINQDSQLEDLRDSVDYLTRAAAEIYNQTVNPPGNAPYLMEAGALAIRGRTSAAGLINEVLAPDTVVTLRVLDLQRGLIGRVTFRTASPGRPTTIPEPIYAVPADFTDTDGDGLIDEFEHILGTSPTKADTDGDGINDWLEITEGLDPLSGLTAATGIIATARTGGNAVDICALNDLAITANEAAGITVLNIFRGLNPTVIAQVDTPGTARRVACAGNFAAVADDTAGLAIIDLTDPPAARIVHQVPVGAAALAVATDGAFAYVGTRRGEVVLVDLASGQVVSSVSVGEEVRDLAFSGDYLFVLTLNQLFILEYLDGSLDQVSSIRSPFPGFDENLRLFVGGGIAYAAHGEGYNTFDVRSPGAPRLIAAGDTGQLGWKQIVVNGSGLGLAAVGANPRLDGAQDVSLYDVSNPANTRALLAEFPTPGKARAVAIFNGLGYIADGTEGLHVLSYRSFDTAGAPPFIRLTTSTAAGFAEEGKLMRVTAEVSDDVQVRNVEFYINGARLVTDGGFPFEARFPVPVSVGGAFTLRARATDTGGNSTWTDEQSIRVVPDATPPRVRRMVPFNGALIGGPRSVSAFFSEPVNPAGLNAATVRVISGGADGVLGNADDTVVSGALEYREALNAVFVQFAERLAPGNYRFTLSPPIADFAGNPLAAPVTAQFRVFSFIDDDQDGMPDELEAALGLDPAKADTDGDGILDGLEDFDNDGLPNAGEVFAGTDPRNRDTDGDGILDGAEDPDGDALTNAREFAAGTNPLVADTDGDGWNDESEVTAGSNPLDPASTPRLLVSGGPGRLQLNLPRLTAGAGSGVTTARPVVSISLPAVTPDLTIGGVTVARPSLSISVTARTESLAEGVVVARPHLSLNLTSISEALKAGVTVARPPLTIRINP